MKHLTPETDSQTMLRYARRCGATLAASAAPSLLLLLAGLLSEPSAATRWLVIGAIFVAAPTVGAIAMLAATVSRSATRFLLLASGAIALLAAVIMTFQITAGKLDADRAVAEIVATSCLALSWLCAFLIVSFTREACAPRERQA